MKKLIIGGAILVLLVVAGLLLAGRGKESQGSYRFVEVTRGDIVSSVSSTGNLQATTTVEVGTQVSGKVAEIYVDFNDRVVPNQLIARIDPTILQQEVRSAEASLDRSRAELDQRQREMDRIQRLYEKSVVTESEFTTAKYQLEVAQASLKSAQVNVERAVRNLGYTEIRAPIGGIVVDRKVDAGQTVAASFSAPLLFLIAQDLSELEILASVDESDIGKIHQGQLVRFTVQAYPDETFEGDVRQVRLQSSTVENVVSYTVVVGVSNPTGRLLPGMTASVDFIIAQALDVLKVPNAAIRFRPTSEMMAAVGMKRGEGGMYTGGWPGGGGAPPGAGAPGNGGAQGSGGPQGSAAPQPGAGADGRGRPPSERPGAEAAGTMPSSPQGFVQPSGAERGAGGQEEGRRAMLWHLNGNDKLAVSRVVTGITDGQYTEIHDGDITEGMQVIAAVTGASDTGPSNPFQGGQGQSRGRPPM